MREGRGEVKEGGRRESARKGERGEVSVGGTGRGEGGPGGRQRSEGSRERPGNGEMREGGRRRAR